MRLFKLLAVFHLRRLDFQSALTIFSHFLKVDSFVQREAVNFLWLSPFTTLCLALMQRSSVKIFSLFYLLMHFDTILRGSQIYKKKEIK